MSVEVPTMAEFIALENRVAALENEQPPIPPDPTPTGGIRVQITYGMKTVDYDSALGTTMDDYIDPLGRFSMGCISCYSTELPALTIFIRRDLTGGRLEVVFELGDMFTTEPFNMNPYTATIFHGVSVLDTIKVPEHFWHSRWRWQSEPRPVTTKVADLIKYGLVPFYDESVVSGNTPASNAHTYTGPMSLAGITPYMPSTGERDDIGIITESQADYLCTGSETALTTLLAQLEGSGTMPWHFRDEETNAPIDVNEYPNATLYSPNGANPYIGKTETGITLDVAHEPSLAYLPFLLTGDPYALEELQYAATYNIVQLPPSARSKWCLGNAVRGHAWALRTLVHVVSITPDVVPSWLKPQTYWQALLDTERDWMINDFVNNTTAPYANFQFLSDGKGSPANPPMPADTTIQPWMDDFELAVLAWVVLLGHESWRPILDWKTKCTVARTNGVSGWIRSIPSLYYQMLRPAPGAAISTTWSANWTLNANTQPDKCVYQDKDKLANGLNLTYPSYALGALAIAAALKEPGAKDCYDWLLGEIKSVSTPSQYISRKWAIGVP